MTAWTSHEINILKQYGLDYQSLGELSATLGRTEDAIRSKIYWVKQKRNNLVVTRG